MYSLASRLYNSVFSDPTEQNSAVDNEQESDVKIEATSSNSTNNPEIDVPITINSNLVISVNDESTTTFPMINSPQLSKSKKLTPIEKSNKLRKKIILEPGHSSLDWAKLKSSGVDLKGVSEIRNYTLEELKKHNRRDDAWSAFNGKIYNITPYIKFHPGGEKELMRGAGKDGTKLFNECFVGYLVGGSHNLLVG
ncbi:14086_t:CDS:2 [Entrophospora sp. SA101]|nr:14345_t:CDS:2 [Entrophospora sp. SA101]CAJ0880881.1 14086_t:CDS:2 [Entrophospora sp. SA101]CAJ0890320.1 12091_t:CDS:2 [Entrophospora sp. SA101]